MFRSNVPQTRMEPLEILLVQWVEVYTHATSRERLLYHTRHSKNCNPRINQGGIQSDGKETPSRYQGCRRRAPTRLGHFQRNFGGLLGIERQGIKDELWSIEEKESYCLCPRSWKITQDVSQQRKERQDRTFPYWRPRARFIQRRKIKRTQRRERKIQCKWLWILQWWSTS